MPDAALCRASRLQWRSIDGQRATILESAKKSDCQTLIELWEASDKATHDFLPEEYLQALKPLILAQYFAAVDLVVAKTAAHKAVGFCGVSDGNIEMLFGAPDMRGQDVGRLLVDHAVRHKGAFQVDVNEQNRQTPGFYQHMGFSAVGRSPVDSQGKPYPLLRMKLGQD